MTAPLGDPGMALAAVSQQDLIQRKQSIDSLRQRLGDTQTKEEALRESCEGFESIFLQKMWEQMRKNVPKEGYLHSKDEEMYQSLFDVELCKKMTSAGGIGLADMLYEQLSQQLVNTGRTTSPSTYRPPVIPPTTSSVLAENAKTEVKEEVAPVLTVENLYTPIAEEPVVEKEPETNPIVLALAEFADVIQKEPESSKVEPGRITPADLPIVPLGAEAKSNAPVRGERIQAASWQNMNRVSATPRPVSKFSRKSSAFKDTTAEAPMAETAKSAVNAQTQMASRVSEESNPTLPDRAFWPIEGKVRTPFGWYEGADQHRDWNPGIFIDAAKGSRVAACMQGEIVYNGEAEGFDNMVVIDHGDDYKTYYGNAVMHGLDVGDTVKGGMLFASVTSSDQNASETAKSSAFYFGLKRGDMALNPESAIPRFLTAQR